MGVVTVFQKKKGLDLLDAVRDPQVWWPWWCLVITLAATGWQGWRWWTMRDAYAQTMSATASLPSTRSVDVVTAEAKALAGVFKGTRFSWSQLLDRLEEAAPPGVSILTIEPSFQGPLKVNMTGLAKTEDDLATFYDRLKHVKGFVRPWIHHSQWTGTPGFLQFQIAVESL